MIRAQGLGFSYEDGATALADVDIEAADGKIVVLAGTNGSGKSTLLTLLSGLQAPGRGSVAVGDCVVQAGSNGKVPDTRCLRRAVALVLQDADLQILGATPREDMGLGFSPDDPQAPARIEDAAARFGLSQCLDAPVQTLSYGQKRKVCLAAALLVEPRPTVLLLDEPFAGLDYPAILEIRRILAQGREQGLTQIVAAHDLEPVADLADAMVVLSAGRVAASGAPGDVLDVVRDHGVRPPCSWTGSHTLVPFS